MNSWQTTIIIVALIAVLGVLGVTHVIGADWIERSLSAVLGILVGHRLGVLNVSLKGAGNSIPPAAPPAPPAAPPAAPTPPAAS